MSVIRVVKELKDALHLKDALTECDDPEIILSAIEGETDLCEAICALDAETFDDEAVVVGIKAAEQKLKDRRERIEKSIATRRNVILMAMERAGIDTIRTPLGTLTKKAVPSAPLVADESLVPARFWTPQEPKLDKKAINDAVKAGESIPGVGMTNGGVSLQIRRV